MDLEQPPNEIEIAEVLSILKDENLLEAHDVIRRLAFQMDKLKAELERWRLARRYDSYPME